MHKTVETWGVFRAVYKVDLSEFPSNLNVKRWREKREREGKRKRSGCEWLLSFGLSDGKIE